jgi:NAD(P)-dependent dehydrogenase (short-subunit alcohol dehydrogenase family)
MAERFAREGVSVIVVRRNEEKGRAVAKKIVDSGGVAHYINNDVSREEDVNNMIDKTFEGCGQKVSLQRRLCI